MNCGMGLCLNYDYYRVLLKFVDMMLFLLLLDNHNRHNMKTMHFVHYLEHDSQIYVTVKYVSNRSGGK
jgi:hypothetical protein